MVVNASDLATTLENPEKQLLELFYADLVVRGVIADVKTEEVRAGDYDPTWNGPDGFFTVKTITFSVEEVLRGYTEGSEVTFCANVSQSTLKGRYEVGDEMIVCLLYKPYIRGGTYVVWSGNSRFAPNDDAWIAQGYGAYELTLPQIRNLVAPTSLEAITTSSQVIVIGTVKTVRQYTINSLPSAPNKSSSRIWEVTLKPEQVLKGKAVSDQLVFDVFYAGSYWPDWAHAGPDKIIEGSRYCAFLKESEGKLRAVCGLNSFFRLTADDHLMHNDLPLHVTTKHVASFVQE
jgi:hypothetical protein